MTVLTRMEVAQIIMTGGFGAARRRTNMKRLTEKLRYVLEDCINCISPIQQEVINRAIDRLATYEDTGLEPEEIELLAKQRDLYVDACGGLPLKRIRELAQADKEGRCLVLPLDIGDTVYHITTCKNFPQVLDGTLYDACGGFGTATGYYCPCELGGICPFDAEDFDCDQNKNKRNIFEDTVAEVHIGDAGNYICLGYSGTVFFDEIGKTVFMNREEAKAALRREQE